MAKKVVSQVATQAMSIEDMRAAIQAEDARIKAEEYAAKQAAKKPVGRPGRKGTSQRTYHLSPDAIQGIDALSDAQNRDMSVIVDELILNSLYSNAKAMNIFNAKRS